MPKLIHSFWVSMVLLFFIAVHALASPGVGARATSMGGAYTALASDSSGFYWNPAGMAQLEGYTPRFDLGLSSQLLSIILNGNITDYMDHLNKLTAALAAPYKDIE